MPVRPSQTDPAAAERWAQARVRFGARLRAIRHERGLTQEALALEAGLSRNQLIKVEWGQSSLAIERLYDLADALNIPPGALIDGPPMPDRVT